MLKYHIQTIEVPAAGASDITFSSIPQIYDDLLICYSARTNRSFYNSDIYLHFNNDTGANYSFRRLYGDGTGSSSDTLSNNSQGGFAGNGVGASATSNTFSNSQIYIPGYRSSVAKSWSVDSVGENNASASLQTIQASIWTGTSPITSISLKDYNAANFTQFSSASLYGIKRGTSVQPNIAATGGEITTAAGYTIHTFTSSGTFVPNRDLQVEYLVIGGGGSGGVSNYSANATSGGGGAGGYRSSVVGELSGRNTSAEARLNLTANTSYAITVGAGGSGSSSQFSNGTSGSNSSFWTVTSNGGGFGSSGEANTNGASGGSGGGGAGRFSTRSGGAGTAGQGFDGGSQTTNINQGGGGGGAGGAGTAQNVSSTYTRGGAGLASAITGIAVTRAIGGQGSFAGSGTLIDGQSNTGNGGDGYTTSEAPNRGGNGGSGVVIVRYLTPLS